MQAFIGIVEDNEDMVRIFQGKFKNQAIIVTNYEEFKEKLLPLADKIKIWFLDIEIPKEKGSKPNAKYGFEIAELLKKLEPNTPRYCISGNLSNTFLYTEHLNKNLSAIIQKVTQLLQQ